MRNDKDAELSGFLSNDLIMCGEGITTMAERLAERSCASYGALYLARNWIENFGGVFSVSRLARLSLH